MEAMAIIHAEQRPVGGAEDMLSMVAEELVGRPVEHAAGMRASVLVTPNLAAVAHQENLLARSTLAKAEALRSGLRDLAETAQDDVPGDEFFIFL